MYNNNVRKYDTCVNNDYYTFILIHVNFANSDIDECSIGTDNCSQTCTNTKGSFTCGCNRGYLLDIDAATCNGMQK